LSYVTIPGVRTTQPSQADCGGINQGVNVGSSARPDRTGHQRVILVGIEMPFWSIVGFMVKWALASISAALIVGFMWFVVLALIAALRLPQ
jgi:hypothetical protein